MSKSKMPNRALRYYRERRNWTQEQAAEALLILCGPGKRGEVNARMISKWERGVQTPSIEYREKLCKLYEVQSPEKLGLVESEANVFEQVGASKAVRLIPEYLHFENDYLALAEYLQQQKAKMLEGLAPGTLQNQKKLSE